MHPNIVGALVEGVASTRSHHSHTGELLQRTQHHLVPAGQGRQVIRLHLDVCQRRIRHPEPDVGDAAEQTESSEQEGASGPTGRATSHSDQTVPPATVHRQCHQPQYTHSATNHSGQTVPPFTLFLRFQMAVETLHEISCTTTA